MIKELFVTDREHDDFVENHPNGAFFQLTNWGKLKEIHAWKWAKVNVGDEEGRITGGAMLLFKKIPKLNLTFCYAPRGLVVDWNDDESVKVLHQAAVKCARANKAIALKIDPDIDEADTELLNLLTKMGYKHLGFDKGMGSYIQPRCYAITDLTPGMDEIFKSVHGNTRTCIRKSEKYGFILEDAPLEDVHIFQELYNITGRRAGFAVREREYFERLYELFNKTDHVKVFLVRWNPEVTRSTIEDDLAKRNREMEKLLKKGASEVAIKEAQIAIDNTQELKNRLGDTKEEMYLSGALFALSGKKGYYMYAGSSDEYRELLPNYFMQWEIMKYAKERGCTSYDFGGISGMEGESGDKTPGLYAFKKRWGAESKGRIGEFDYVFKPFWYKLMNMALKVKS